MKASRQRAGAFVLFVAFLPRGTAAEPAAQDLTRLSIEELARVKVVTAGRRPQALREAPSAISVITAEDIRRTGSTTLPDAMRLAPGLQASRIDANEWALGIRGFVSRLSRSTQVMMDGRILWTPLFAGVFWDTQDAMLEDLDRIEISGGPGGPLYGANALNGVINIISKSAADTQGGLFSTSVGTGERAVNARWGGSLGEDAHYRIYGRYLELDGTRPVTTAYDDDSRMGRGGFRVDWHASDRDALQLHGDFYGGNFGESVVVADFNPPYSVTRTGTANVHGGNAVARWGRALDNGALAVRASYDSTYRREVYYSEQRDTLYLDAQHRMRWGGRHELVWGADYQGSRGDFAGIPTLQIIPGRRTDDIVGAFANDEVRLHGDRLRLTLGGRLEWNDYSGVDAEPGVRLAWVTSTQTLWAAYTRAKRTSSRVERDVLLYTSLSPSQPLFARTTGSPDFIPESVFTLEAGYKLQASRKVYGTFATFYGSYDDLATNEPGSPTAEAGPPPRVVIPVRIANGQEARSWGTETAVIVRLSPAVRLQATHTFLGIDQSNKAWSVDTSRGFEGNSPRHQIWLASYLTPTPRVDVDTVLRHVTEIRSFQVPAFTELDARLAVRPERRLELAVVGKNLLHRAHREFGGGFEVERTVSAQAIVTW